MLTRLKRGPTVQLERYVGPEGSIAVDTELKNLRLQDGVTPGGVATLGADISLEGPLEIPTESTAIYRIVNYDTFSEYGVSCTGAEASIDGDTITLVHDGLTLDIRLIVYRDDKGSLFNITADFPMLMGIMEQMSGGPPSRESHLMEAVGNKIYVALGRAGSGSGNIRRDLWEYDITSDSWTQLNSELAPTAYQHVASTVHNDKIYVYGGSGANGSSTRDLWMIDTTAGQWVLAHPSGDDCPPKRELAALSALDNKLYLFGGRGGTNPYSDFWCYDLDEGTWTEITPDSENVPAGAAGATLVTIENKLYLLAGNNLWSYDPANNTWDLLRDTNMVEDYTNGHAVVKGKLYIIAGTTDVNIRPRVYDPLTNEWTAIPITTYPARRSGAKATAAGNRLYMFGGRRTYQFFHGDLWRMS